MDTKLEEGKKENGLSCSDHMNDVDHMITVPASLREQCLSRTPHKRHENAALENIGIGWKFITFICFPRGAQPPGDARDGPPIASHGRTHYYTTT
jgi:hypothetical protein